MNIRFRLQMIFSALLLIGLLLGIAVLISAVRHIQAAPEAENLDKWVIAASGGAASASNIELTDVLGQPVIGESGDAADIVLESGFLNSGDAPTAVDVSSFNAVAVSTSAVMLTWQTTFELNLVGFNLYRGSSLEGPFARMNPEHIPAQGLGGMFSQVYTYTDQDVYPGQAYVYLLEALHTDQPATRYDAVWVTVATDVIYLPLVRR
jgi:hypothetical protein